jgi:hypothetical protein
MVHGGPTSMAIAVGFHGHSSAVIGMKPALDLGGLGPKTIKKRPFNKKYLK